KIRQQIDRRPNRQRDVNQISIAQRQRKIAAQHIVERLRNLCGFRDVWPIPSRDVQIGRIFAQRQRKRAADQPRAKYRDALNHMRHRENADSASKSMRSTLQISNPIANRKYTVIPSEARDLLFSCAGAIADSSSSGMN